MAELPDWVREELERRADVPTCVHGVPSPCGICGEFTEDRNA